jgi:hypothetical protein
MGASRAEQQAGRRISIDAGLEGIVGAFTAGHLSLVILVGGPGLQRSRIVRHAVRDSAGRIEGGGRRDRFYLALWVHRDRSVILADLFADRGGSPVEEGLPVRGPQDRFLEQGDPRSCPRRLSALLPNANTGIRNL